MAKKDNSSYLGVQIYVTKVGKYYVRVLRKSFISLRDAKNAIKKWTDKQIAKDMAWAKRKGKSLW